VTTLETDEHWMRRCIELAREALTRSDIPVGALIVAVERLLAEASERVPTKPDVTGHAEVLAVRAACEALGRADLHGCTLYSTAEPCWMCSYAIREARISRVVFGTLTPIIGGVSSAYPILQTTAVPYWGAPPQIVPGVLAAECAALRRATVKGDVRV